MADELPETKAEETNPSEIPSSPAGNEDSGIKWGRTIISIVVILAAAGIMLVLYQNRENGSSVTQHNDPGRIETPEQLTAPPASETTPPAHSESLPETPAPSQPVMPRAEQAPPEPIVPPRVSGVVTVAPTWNPRTHAEFGFQYIIRGSWQDKKVADDMVVVYNPESGEIMGTVEILTQPGVTINSIHGQLNNSPTISNIQTIKKNGQTFLHYNLKDSDGYGYATINGDKVYYLVDFSEGNVIAQNFRAL